MPEVAILVTAKDQASATLGKVGGSLGKVGKAATVMGVAGVAALGGIAIGATKLAMDAAQLEPVRVTFDNLTASIGSTADAMLDKLRPATMGIVSDADLMKAANKLMAMGLAESEEEAAKLAEMAVKLGTAMGYDATESMENFALMLANQSIPRLDSFGISAGKVRERINELMEADKSLTREQAFLTATMEYGEDAMKRVGDVSETGAVKMAQFRATIANLKDTVGKALLPVFHAFLDKVLTPLAQKLAELMPKVEMLIETFGLLIKEIFGGDMERAVSFLENEVWEVLDNVFGREMADKIVAFGTRVLGWVEIFRTQVVPVIQDLAARALPILQKAIAFVTEHWQTFAKIGAVVGAAIIAISSPVTVLIAAIAALAAAWATNWGGIQDKVRGAWAFIQPILEKIGEIINWVREKILPPLAEAFSKVWGFIKEVVKKAWEGFKPHIEDMKEALAEFWEEFKPKLEEAWEKIKEAMKKVADWVAYTLIPLLRDLWDRLEPVRQKIVELAGRFADFMGSAFVEGLKIWLNAIITLFDAVYRAIKGVWDIIGWLINKIKELIDWLIRLAEKLPSWLRPGSASPLELSIRGIGEAFRELSGGIPMGLATTATMTHRWGGSPIVIRVEGLSSDVAEDLENKIAENILTLLYPGR